MKTGAERAESRPIISNCTQLTWTEMGFKKEDACDYNLFFLLRHPPQQHYLSPSASINSVAEIQDVVTTQLLSLISHFAANFHNQGLPHASDLPFHC